MARTSWGGHGKVCLRQNGTMMMTIRPEPFVGDAKDIAMLLGFRMDILCGYNGSSSRMTHTETLHEIWSWQSEHGKLTQSRALELITDRYYLSQYEEGAELHEMFDEDNMAHLALLHLVLRLWPAFKEPTDACEA